MPQEAAALPHPQVVFVSLHHPVHYARSTAVWRKETPRDITPTVADGASKNHFLVFLVIPLRVFDFDLD